MPRATTPLVEAFLIIEQPRQRLSHWSQALAPLDDGRAPPLASITAHYDPNTDQALIALRYDEFALGRERLAFVIEIALLAEIGMIQPAELTDGDRRRFVGERLTRCTVQASERSVVASLTELVRRIREHRLANPRTITGRDDTFAAPRTLTPPAAPRTFTPRDAKTPPPIPAARASTQPRGTTQDPVLLVSPTSTRDDLPQVPRQARATRDFESTQEDVLHPPRTPSPNVIARERPVHRAETVHAPQEAERMAAELRGHEYVETVIDAPTSKRAGSPIDVTVEPYLPTTNTATPPGIIYARYLRSGRWVPLRIGALSLKGAALMTGALPRLHDHVDVALSFADHRALVRGPVKKVSTMEEAAMSGAATFSVSFELDDASRRQLTSLLTAARAAQVTIKPPPPRQARRFVVEWPVCLGTIRGAIRAEALDISRDGMFVRPVHPLALDSTLNFSAVLDEGGSPISGRARVVRHLREAEARSCGLAPGYGLQITEMADSDHERWARFLSRIEKRADKRVLIGAAAARLAELQAALAALGYAVTGGTDPGALVQLASADRPVDAVLMDGGWLAPGTSISWIESLFSARNVPCVTMHGDARRGRAAIDKLLAIV